MSSAVRPIKLYGQGGLNPAKVRILLEELHIPFEAISVKLADVKNPEYVAINPNGRVPAIYDPNSGITLWESGAIMEYITERYDSKHQMSFPPGSNEAYHAKQWLFYQMSGQGPYYGQASWFLNFHPEKLPSAIERYIAEINRVSGVLDAHLGREKEKHGSGPWLVGNKYSFADLAFLAWQNAMSRMLSKEQYDVDKYPQLKQWLANMNGREASKAFFENFARPE